MIKIWNYIIIKSVKHSLWEKQAEWITFLYLWTIIDKNYHGSGTEYTSTMEFFSTKLIMISWSISNQFVCVYFCTFVKVLVCLFNCLFIYALWVFVCLCDVHACLCCVCVCVCVFMFLYISKRLILTIKSN